MLNLQENDPYSLFKIDTIAHKSFNEKHKIIDVPIVP